MNRQLVILPLCGLLLVFFSASWTTATVAVPKAWWNFDNEEGQSLATSDGIVPDKGAGGIDLLVRQYNGHGDSPLVYRTFQSGISTYPPPEHYEASGATFAGAGSAYHLEGGYTRIYDDGSGNPENDPNADLRSAGVLELKKDIFSFRDWLLPDPADTGGLLDSSGGANGGSLTYSFWLNIQAATRSIDSQRFGSDTSFLIGRGSGDANGYSGEVSIRRVGGFAANPEYALQVRNDRLYDGSFAPMATRIQDTDALGITVGKQEWHHFVIQYDLTGATGSVQVWMDGGTSNGGLQGTLTGLGNRPISGAFHLNQVGHPGAAQKESGDFIVDDLAVWSGVLLNDADVSALYQNGVAVATVPEPGSLALLLMGAVGLVCYRRRSK